LQPGFNLKFLFLCIETALPVEWHVGSWFDLIPQTGNPVATRPASAQLQETIDPRWPHCSAYPAARTLNAQHKETTIIELDL